MENEVGLQAKEIKLVRFLYDRWHYEGGKKNNPLVISLSTILRSIGCDADDLFAIFPKLQADKIVSSYHISPQDLAWIVINPTGMPRQAVEAYPLLEVEGLAYYSDNTIRFKNTLIPIRKQLVSLCKLFMERVGTLVTYDDVRDRVIKANKRSHTSFKTLEKYVSALRSSLKSHFKKDVFINVPSEGWYFKPKK